MAGLKFISREENFRRAMENLGKTWEVPPELFLILQEFTCRMYAPQSSITQVNELRYQLFRLKKGNVESAQLPTCEDIFYLHTHRANYQAAVWHRSLEVDPDIPSPEGNGWQIEDGQLTIHWMQGPPAPDVILEFMSCKHSRIHKHPSCPCLAYGIPCTPAGKLQICDNMIVEEDATVQDELDSEESGNN